MRSFRTRLLIGSIIFAGGMLGVFHLFSMAMFRRFPHSFVMRIDHASIVAVALIFIAVGVAQMRRGLSPFDQLRERLGAVRDGSERRLEGRYPSEVQPLVNDLNGMLDHRDEIVRRALGKAGDLAHASKRRSLCSCTKPIAPLPRDSTKSPQRCARSSTACAARSITTSRTPVPPPPAPPSARAVP